jgi:DNA polymerase III delta prime subunit
MNQLLINKYKPKEISDFNFPKNIENLLTTIIDSKQYNILITGNSSTGKTSLIKLIINNYYNNNEDLNIDTLNQNILYVTPLKDVGIHNFRSEIKIFCQTYCNIKNKKKFVILDDIDLMNEQIQQVMRNIIDTYNSNVYFICSCTNTSKVIDNLQSRLFILKLPNITNERLKLIYNRIKNNEKIDIDEESLDLFIKICNNSPSVLLNYLEVFKLLDIKINKSKIMELCTTINFSYYETFFDLLKKNKIIEAVERLMIFIEEGYNVMDVYDSIFYYIKHTENLNEEEKYIITPIICKYITIFHEIHEDEIELAFFTNTIFKKLYMKKNSNNKLH